MLWYVIMPQLRPATFIAVVVTVIGALRSFDLVSIMTELAAPIGSTRVLSYYMYEQALSEYGYRMGYGAAIAVVLFAIMMVFISGFIWKMRRDEKEAKMFPRPIQEQSPCPVALRHRPAHGADPVAVPADRRRLTSVRPASDLAAGQLFRHAVLLAWENYVDVFENTPSAVHPELFHRDHPDGDRRGRLSLMTGFALAVYKFRPNLLLFFMFVAGNFVPFQILMVPVRD
jgi:hypothetical protein